MKILGIILVVIAYIQGMSAMFYFGILPAIGRVWTWADYGLPLVVGLVSCIVFYNLGDWLRNKAKKKVEQKGDDK